ncbi:cell division protein SepF [Natronosporangium hydrolyticum]|uniref:Cell division protein SepF n=1 Tax=Natronosporangium hydrolyticum TaxID=2811111 RepID=A0A895YER7_9ACTN|nr:cell division protein SepF [Natronosporangium hydrolyticum]QSB16354.1 cell division protein SepF [Natronosporangium hydrolyticum]
MSALRKAGVWLGLIEDESDAYDEREFTQAGRDRARPRRTESAAEYDDDYGDEDEAPPSRSRESLWPAERAPERASERAPERAPERSADRGGARRPERSEEARSNVRSITRESASRDGGVSHLTRDNLALAPSPVVPNERAASEEERRYQITTLHPTTYREARTIGEHFREGTPVIMNLTEMEEADARRLVDFGAGLAFGLRGTMERVTNRVFLLSPANVHVTAEDKAKIAEGEFFHHR